MTEKKGTKVKKMTEEKAVTVAETKEVDFGNIELTIAKPTLNSDKTLSIGGNFAEVGKKIQSVVDRYKNTKLTEDNVEYVKTLKKQFVSLRTGIDRERKEYMKVYITPAKDLVDSMCKELLAIVDSGESALGKQLDEYDQRRKDELTVILKEYVADAVAKHNLRDEYATQIQLKKEYYNKTQNEEDSADDIEAQACELEKKQTEHDAGVKLITAECEDAGLLATSYIRELQYKSAMEIILEIKQDKKRKAELKAKEEAGEPVEIGEPIPEELKRAKALDAKESEKRTRVLRVTYKAEQAKLMAKFFTENNIHYEFIHTEF
jgi:hypothetical protein